MECKLLPVLHGGQAKEKFCGFLGVFLLVPYRHTFKIQAKHFKQYIYFDLILASTCASSLYNVEKQQHEMLLCSVVSHVGR